MGFGGPRGSIGAGIRFGQSSQHQSSGPVSLLSLNLEPPPSLKRMPAATTVRGEREKAIWILEDPEEAKGRDQGEEQCAYKQFNEEEAPPDRPHFHGRNLLHSDGSMNHFPPGPRPGMGPRRLRPDVIDAGPRFLRRGGPSGWPRMPYPDRQGWLVANESQLEDHHQTEDQGVEEQSSDTSQEKQYTEKSPAGGFDQPHGPGPRFPGPRGPRPRQPVSEQSTVDGFGRQQGPGLCFPGLRGPRSELPGGSENPTLGSFGRQQVPGGRFPGSRGPRPEFLGGPRGPRADYLGHRGPRPEVPGPRGMRPDYPDGSRGLRPDYPGLGGPHPQPEHIPVGPRGPSTECGQYPEADRNDYEYDPYTENSAFPEQEYPGTQGSGLGPRSFRPNLLRDQGLRQGFNMEDNLQGPRGLRTGFDMGNRGPRFQARGPGLDQGGPRFPGPSGQCQPGYERDWDEREHDPYNRHPRYGGQDTEQSSQLGKVVSTNSSKPYCCMLYTAVYFVLVYHRISINSRYQTIFAIYSLLRYHWYHQFYWVSFVKC